jgi:hypothetical protein
MLQLIVAVTPEEIPRLDFLIFRLHLAQTWVQSITHSPDIGPENYTKP